MGAGVGCGFSNTNELKVLTNKESMASSEKEELKASVAEEHDRMVKHKVWEPVECKDVPNDATFIT